MAVGDVIRQIREDLGIDVAVPAPASRIDHLPSALRDFYAITDGIELPMLTIDRARDVTSATADFGTGPEWLVFGTSPVGDVCMCRTQPVEGLSITIWNPDDDVELEPAYASVDELIADEYERFLAGTCVADLTILDLPSPTSLAAAVSEIKHLLPGETTSAIAAKLRVPPAEYPAVPLGGAVRAARALRRLGITAHAANHRII